MAEETRKVSPQTADAINDILSGADKTMRDDFREAHAGLAEGNSPIVILPP